MLFHHAGLATDIRSLSKPNDLSLDLFFSEQNCFYTNGHDIQNILRSSADIALALLTNS
jgi:hypothetical protein